MTKVQLFFQTKLLKLQDIFKVMIFHDVAKRKTFDIKYLKKFIFEALYVPTISQYKGIGKYVKSKYTESFFNII